MIQFLIQNRIMPITHITTKQDLLKIKNDPNQYSIIEFYAEWCLTCNHLEEWYENLSKLHSPKFNFYKIDDKHYKELSKICEITAIPTFDIYKNGVRVFRTTGSDKNSVMSVLNCGEENPEKLEKIYQKYLKEFQKTKILDQHMPMITNMGEYDTFTKIRSSNSNGYSPIFVNFYIDNYQDDVTEFMEKLLAFKIENKAFQILRVDLDKYGEIGNELDLNVLPCLRCYDNGQLVDQIECVDMERVERLFRRGI